jgi:hypothetical protein
LQREVADVSEEVAALLEQLTQVSSTGWGGVEVMWVGGRGGKDCLQSTLKMQLEAATAEVSKIVSTTQVMFMLFMEGILTTTSVCT